MAVKLPLFDPTVWQASATLNTRTFNGTNDKCGFTFVAGRSCGAVKIGLSFGTVTGWTGNLRVGIETLTGNVPNSVASYVGSAGDLAAPTSNTWHWVDIDANLTAGTRYAVTVRCTSFSAGSAILNVFYNGYGSMRTPTFVEGMDGGAWAATTTVGNVVCAIVADDIAVGSYPQPGALAEGFMPVRSLSVATNINDGTNPDEVGVKFVAPMNGAVCGAFLVGGMASAAHSDVSTLTLYDDADAVLGTIPVDTRAFSSPSTVGKIYASNTDLGAGLAVVAGRTYRLAYKGPAGDTTNSTRLLRATMPDFTALGYDQGALTEPFYGAAMLTTRNNGGAWTDSAVDLVAIVPYISLPGGSAYAAGNGGGCFWGQS